MIAISNDCMRDHWLNLLEARPFLRWKTTQVRPTHPPTHPPTQSILNEHSAGTSLSLFFLPITHPSTHPPTHPPTHPNQVQSYRFDYSPEDNNARSVSFTSMSFSREAQRTPSSSSSSSSSSISSTSSCLHLPSDQGDEWLCLDFAATERELTKQIEKEAQTTARPKQKEEKEEVKGRSPTRGLGFLIRPRAGGLFGGWGKKKREEEEEEEDV